MIKYMQKGFTAIMLFIGVLVAIAIGGAYYAGTLKNKPQLTPITNSVSYQTPQPSVAPISNTENPEKLTKNKVAETILFYGKKGNEIYLKMDLLSYGPKALHGSANLKDPPKNYNWVFKEDDISFDPVEIANFNINSINWKEIIKKPIADFDDTQRFIVSDRIFSFKTIPNSDDVLIVMEWRRSHTKDEKYNWENIENKRMLYRYEAKTNQLKQLEVFDEAKYKQSYPKIKSFSADATIAEVLLFSCWNCGGHMPETMLLRLDDLKTKNLGKVSEFNWAENNSFTYKDYIVIECSEPTPGDCSEDPKNLPLKTGEF